MILAQRLRDLSIQLEYEKWVIANGGNFDLAADIRQLAQDTKNIADRLERHADERE